MRLVRRILARLVSGETPSPAAIGPAGADTLGRRQEDLLAAFLGGADIVRLDDYRAGRSRGAQQWTT